MQSAGPYAFAKACGIIGKSFVGKRISSLSGLRSLTEMDRLVFQNLRQDLPGKELLIDLENRIIDRSVKQILSIVGAYDTPPLFLVIMLKVYEYTNLKTCIHHIAGGKTGRPVLCDIGRFATVNFDAFPDLSAMLKKTEFEFLLKDLKSIKPGADFTAVETKLDNHYYNALTESLSTLSAKDREIAQKVLAEEISLRNCVWALRLRTYYQKTPAETGKYLMDLKIKNSSLATEAVKSLQMPLDGREHWRGWKWEKFLNPEKPNAHWSADPRYFQNAASQYIYRLVMRYFHASPTEISAIFCFIKIKQFEEDLLTSIAEGLSLGMDSAGVFDLLYSKSEVSA